MPDPFAEGAIRLHVHETVSPRHLATWSPERITAFFAGIVQVIEAARREEVIPMSDDPKEPERDDAPDKKEDESERGKDPQAP